METFIFDLNRWGLHTALSNQLILFTKWFVGAKRVQISYTKKERVIQ